MADLNQSARGDGKPRWNSAMAAAIVGGAAGAGAVWSAKRFAKRRRDVRDKPLNAAMQAAVTACEVAPSPADPIGR